MPLPIKSRYTLQEAAKFIASATGERVTRSQVIDWGTQEFYGLYMLVDHCHVQYEDDKESSEIRGSLIQVHPNATQAATLESGYSMQIQSGLHDGRKFKFLERVAFYGSWRRAQPESFNSTSLILLGTELVAFTATIAEPQPTAPAIDTASPVPVVAGGASGDVGLDVARPGWNLKTSIDRAPGYRWPLYQFLQAAHVAGQSCPKAREVLDAWALKPPPNVQVMSDGIKYDNGLGKTKEANLRAMQQAIKGLLK